MILSFNVLMLLHLLFSLNCLIPRQVRTWHHLLHRWKHQNVFFNLEIICQQSHPPMWGVFSLLFLTYAWSCYHDKPPTSCGLWIMIITLYKKSNFCRLLSMGMVRLNCCPSIWMLITLPKCKAWTKSMMAMLRVSWSQPI